MIEGDIRFDFHLHWLVTVEDEDMGTIQFFVCEISRTRAQTRVRRFYRENAWGDCSISHTKQLTREVVRL